MLSVSTTSMLPLSVSDVHPASASDEASATAATLPPSNALFNFSSSCLHFGHAPLHSPLYVHSV